MRRYENLYAGLIGKHFVGGLDLDLLDKQAAHLPHIIDIKADDGTVVGFLSLDQLRLAFENRKKGGNGDDTQ